MMARGGERRKRRGEEGNGKRRKRYTRSLSCEYTFFTIFYFFFSEIWFISGPFLVILFSDPEDFYKNETICCSHHNYYPTKNEFNTTNYNFLNKIQQI